MDDDAARTTTIHLSVAAIKLDCRLTVYFVQERPLVCLHEVAIKLLGVSERPERPGTVSKVSECWDTLGIGRGTRRVPLDGDKHYATISYMDRPPTEHLMLTFPQLMQAVNGDNGRSASHRQHIVHVLAPRLRFAEVLVRDDFIQLFKDAAPHQVALIKALSEHLHEPGNESLRRQFTQEIVIGGRPNPKAFIDLLAEGATRKDFSDANSRVALVWEAVLSVADPGKALSTVQEKMDLQGFSTERLMEALNQLDGAPGPSTGFTPQQTNEHIVAVLVRLLLSHEEYIHAVLKTPVVLTIIKEAIFGMIKDRFEVARRMLTLVLKTSCGISNVKLNTVVREAFGPLEQLLLPAGERMLASSRETAETMSTRGKEMGLRASLTANGEMVFLPLAPTLRAVVETSSYRLATPMFDGKQHQFLFLLDSAQLTKAGKSIGTSGTPIVIVPTSIRPLSQALAAAVLIGVTNVPDKDTLELREVMAPLLKEFGELNDSETFLLPCPHTGHALSSQFMVALDGAAWCMAAHVKGPLADRGKFAFTDASTAEILQSEKLHLATLSDLHEVNTWCEEMYHNKTTEQRKTAATETCGIMGAPLFPIESWKLRRGSLHLMLTPTNYLWTQTCSALTAHGWLCEGAGVGGDFLRWLRFRHGLDVELIDTREHGPFAKVHGGNGGRELLGRHRALFISGADDAEWGGTRHPAYKLCIMLAEIWAAFYSVIRVVRTDQWAVFDRELPELFERSQMLLELCKVVFGKYSPYLASFNNIVLHHCWQAHALKRTYNLSFDDSTVEMMHYSLSQLSTVGHGGGRARGRGRARGASASARGGGASA